MSMRDYYRPISQPHEMSFKGFLFQTDLIFLPEIYEIRKLFSFLQILKNRLRLNIIL
ncbi:hypothetical protein SNEBB_004064, partial [Seison nebaliae]